MSLDLTEVDLLLTWIRERLSIMKKRAAGAPPPWTDDPVMQKYRFTNVRRDWDRTSVYIHSAIRRSGNALTPTHRAFACAIARRINDVSTLQAIGFPKCAKTWDSKAVKRAMHALADNGQRVFGAAYMMMGGVKGSLIDVTVDEILTPIRDTLIEMIDRHSLANSYYNVQRFKCMGTFVAGQVVMDCHAVGLIEPNDLHSWAPVGPGSGFGLNRLYGRPKNFRVGPDRAIAELRRIMSVIRRRLPNELRDMPLYDLEHCVCEYYKWRKGGGKQRFDDGSKRRLVTTNERADKAIRAMTALVDHCHGLSNGGRGMSGTIECPNCSGNLMWSRASVNGHFVARCTTPGCVGFIQ